MCIKDSHLQLCLLKNVLDCNTLDILANAGVLRPGNKVTSVVLKSVYLASPIVLCIIDCTAEPDHVWIHTISPGEVRALEVMTHTGSCDDSPLRVMQMKKSGSCRFGSANWAWVGPDRLSGWLTDVLLTQFMPERTWFLRQVGLLSCPLPGIIQSVCVCARGHICAFVLLKQKFLGMACQLEGLKMKALYWAGRLWKDVTGHAGLVMLVVHDDYHNHSNMLSEHISEWSVASHPLLGEKQRNALQNQVCSTVLDPWEL